MAPQCPLTYTFFPNSKGVKLHFVRNCHMGPEGCVDIGKMSQVVLAVSTAINRYGVIREWSAMTYITSAFFQTQTWNQSETFNYTEHSTHGSPQVGFYYDISVKSHPPLPRLFTFAACRKNLAVLKECPSK